MYLEFTMQTIVSITLENAQALLIEESFKRPVLVDFWADWCAPCKTLMPILEKLAKEFDGAFLLAKVNADTENMIASQFGVRSLPTVMLIKDGQPLDGFVGAKTENEVRELLAKHLPKPWEAALSRAQTLIADGDIQSALPVLRQVYDESAQQPQVGCLLAQQLVELNRLEEAEAILQKIKLVDQDTLYEQVLAQFQLKQQAAKTPELAALEDAYAAQPNDLSIAYQLALQLHQELLHRPALELLLKILREDRNFSEGAVKKTMTDILASLGKGDPIAVEYQRKLFTLLY
jgi:putative thioredoxin